MRSSILSLFMVAVVLTVSQNCRADKLALPGPYLVAPSGTISVSVQVFTTEALNIQAFDIALAFDATKFTIGNVRLSSATQSAFSITSNTSIVGNLVASAAANSNGIDLLNATATDLVFFDLTAKAGAVGSSDLNILANISTTFTSINENLTLNPKPTNSFDTGVDTTITIGNAAVPEPRASVLMAIGLVIGAVLSSKQLRNTWRQAETLLHPSR